MKFWIDEAPTSSAEGRTSSLGDDMPPRVPPTHVPVPPFPSLSAREGERAPPSPERREGTPPDQAAQGRGPGNERPQTPRIPPEDNVPKGCSLHSMEQWREWFCKGADMTSPAEYEAALCQLEDNPVQCQYSRRTLDTLLFGRCEVPYCYR